MEYKNNLPPVTDYCIKSVSQAFNSRVSSDTIPCINKAIHMLLVHNFGTLKNMNKSSCLKPLSLDIDILYAVSLSRPLPSLFKLCPWGQ